MLMAVVLFPMLRYIISTNFFFEEIFQNNKNRCIMPCAIWCVTQGVFMKVYKMLV